MPFAGKVQKGFTLVELISILVLVAVLGATATSRFVSSASYKLQESRDRVSLAFQSAQQLAMTRSGSVTFSTSGTQINVVREGTSVLLNGVQYPLQLESGQSVSTSSFTFDRLGRTPSGSISISGDGQSVLLNVSSAGNIQ